MSYDRPAQAITLPGAPPQFLFILGTGRCGSTLVHDIIANHTDVGFISNMDVRLRRLRVMGRLNGPLYRALQPGRSTEAHAIVRAVRLGHIATWARVRYSPSEAWPMFDDDVSPMIAAPCRDLTSDDAAPWVADRFRRFFTDRALAQSRPVFLHKFTGWPRAQFVHAILPRARFLHVVRDGRAVANSLVQMPWWRGYRAPSDWTYGPLPTDSVLDWERCGRSFPVLAALEWKMLIDAFAIARENLPTTQWLEVRYEDFTHDPRAHTARILEFAGLPWTSGFEARLSRMRVHPARADFRKHLSARDLELVESVIGDHLDRLGYRGPMTASIGATPHGG